MHLLKRKATPLFLLLSSLCISNVMNAQTMCFRVTKNIKLPEDSVFKNNLLNDLDQLLKEAEKGSGSYTRVLKSEKLATIVLLDEMQDLKRSGKYKDSNFYKCYLTNVMKLNDSSAIVQLAYIGMQNDTALSRANILLRAEIKGSRFFFHSTLHEQTKDWKTKRMGATLVHYRTEVNWENAKKYFDLAQVFDQRLNAPVYQTEFYVCANFYEVMQLSGLQYLSDYNGYAKNSLISKSNDSILYLSGLHTSEFLKYDPHDVWHSRLHYVMSTDIINRPVDEGTACLYGGSWGLSWEEILKRFKAYSVVHPEADWLQEYNESINFDPKSKFPLNVDHIINALIIQKIEQEKGFGAVKELLSCGKKEKDNANYFKALEKITGIDKTNFNAYVWTLIKAN